MAKKQISTKKVKKKKWFPVLAPNIFSNKVLGESLLTEPSQLKGRFMTMNLMNITGNPKQQSISLQFRIIDVKEGRGITTTVKYELLTSAVKRMIRRGRNKIDDSFIIKGKEGKLRVKSLAITKGNVSKAVQTSIRLESRKLLKELLIKKSFESTVDDLIKSSIQKDVRAVLNKISPVKSFDVRVFKFDMGKDIADIQLIPEEEVVEEVTEEPKESTPKKKTKAATEEDVVEETTNITAEEVTKEVAEVEEVAKPKAKPKKKATKKVVEAEKE